MLFAVSANFETLCKYLLQAPQNLVRAIPHRKTDRGALLGPWQPVHGHRLQFSQLDRAFHHLCVLTDTHTHTHNHTHSES